MTSRTRLFPRYVGAAIRLNPFEIGDAKNIDFTLTNYVYIVYHHMC